MGMVFGKISVETAKHEVVQSSEDYEIRKYTPCVVAEVAYDPSKFGGDRDGGFMVLANYIGAVGNPQNTKPEKIAMTAPVITTQKASEKIAMTAPVITTQRTPETVDTHQEKTTATSMVMQFVLPTSKYTSVEQAPKPTDERVVIREEGERKYAVVKFSGLTTDQLVEEKVKKLKESLERDGCKIITRENEEPFLLARYNPPWTLPMFRTNEIMIPVE
ncbi:hypothetical protein C5167_046034 [Papaver somniferum]|uniref:SOUL heme-binding protein n=1 Tax=Papaver somniferum TaxID=3469 RepID=A0A4Y7LGG2_PAPSO|nr:heme-binding-like protein At3g10130, chloroplastic [Papaver somniferum]RZC83245.1 hypothetical protein C5167_046034 [Papaver somniferum]